MADDLEQVEIQWHPGFYGAAEIELIANKGDLEFIREYNLSKEPIRMDLLIIKKLSDVRIKNEIGHIYSRKGYDSIENTCRRFEYASCVILYFLMAQSDIFLRRTEQIVDNVAMSKNRKK